MADYPIIADVSNYIVRTLREKMCPEPIPSPNNIEVSTPAESDVDYILGLYLYDVREEGEVAVPAMVSSGRTRLRRPSRPYSLYYMLFLLLDTLLWMIPYPFLIHVALYYLYTIHFVPYFHLLH